MDNERARLVREPTSRIVSVVLAALLLVSALAPIESLAIDRWDAVATCALVAALASEVARRARAIRVARVGVVAWLVASETAFAVGLVSGRWLVAVLCSMGWAALSNLRAYQDEVSKQAPAPLLDTTAAFVGAGLVATRSAHEAAVLVLSYLPIAAASGMWGGFASNRRIGQETRARVESAIALSRHATLTREAGELGALEARLRERLVAALDQARLFLATPTTGQGMDGRSVFDSLDVLRVELRAVNTIGRRAVSQDPRDASSPPSTSASTFGVWVRDLRAYAQGLFLVTRYDVLASGTAWLVMSSVGAWMPRLRDSIALVPWITLFVGVGGLPFIIILDRRAVRAASTAGFLTCQWTSVTIMQIACAALVACSGPEGSIAYVAQYSAIIVGQGFHYRFSLRTPWVLATSLTGLVVGWFVARGDVQRSIVLTTFVLSMPLALVAGGLARDLDRLAESTRQARREWEAHRDEEVRARLRDLSDALRGLFGGAHDASSPFLAARLAATRLEGAEGREIADLNGRLAAHVGEVARRLEKTLATNAPRTGAAVPVSVPDVMTPLLRAVRAGIDVATELEPCVADVHEGVETLRRVVANVLSNAVDAARERVRVACVPTADGHVELVFEDDGAGFHEGYSIRAFGTGKPNGVGLGLFVVDRLASLSGGALDLGRSPDLGGARVTIRLLASKSPASGEAG
ncbi:MAG: hypothetical protein KF764_00750 [Labilithrix sp.]|nr:hypothetical protein [Labilithrix sp.]